MRHGKGSDLVVDEQQAVAVGNVEVVGHHALAAVLHWFVIEGTETGAIQFCKHRHLLLGHVTQIEVITHFANFLGGVSTKEERIIRHIEEVFPVVVDDVDALVGGLREGLCRLYVGHRPLVVNLGDTLNTVCLKEEIVFLCHTAHWIYGAKVIIFWG